MEGGRRRESATTDAEEGGEETPSPGVAEPWWARDSLTPAEKRRRREAHFALQRAAATFADPAEGWHYHPEFVPGVSLWRFLGPIADPTRPGELVRHLRVWLPDTILFDTGPSAALASVLASQPAASARGRRGSVGSFFAAPEAPAWLYCDGFGRVQRFERVSEKRVLARMGSPQFPSDPVVVRRSPHYGPERGVPLGRLRALGTDTTVLSTRELREIVVASSTSAAASGAGTHGRGRGAHGGGGGGAARGTSAAGSAAKRATNVSSASFGLAPGSHGFLLQRFIKCHGPQATVTRCHWRPAGEPLARPPAWVITNRRRFEDAELGADVAWATHGGAGGMIGGSKGAGSGVFTSGNQRGRMDDDAARLDAALLTNTRSPHTCTIHAASLAAARELLELTQRVADHLSLATGLKFSDLVCDWLRGATDRDRSGEDDGSHGHGARRGGAPTREGASTGGLDSRGRERGGRGPEDRASTSETPHSRIFGRWWLLQVRAFRVGSERDGVHFLPRAPVAVPLLAPPSRVSVDPRGRPLAASTATLLPGSRMTMRELAEAAAALATENTLLLEGVREWGSDVEGADEFREAAETIAEHQPGPLAEPTVGREDERPRARDAPRTTSRWPPGTREREAWGSDDEGDDGAFGSPQRRDAREERGDEAFPTRTMDGVFHGSVIVADGGLSARSEKEEADARAEADAVVHPARLIRARPASMFTAEGAAGVLERMVTVDRMHLFKRREAELSKLALRDFQATVPSSDAENPFERLRARSPALEDDHDEPFYRLPAAHPAGPGSGTAAPAARGYGFDSDIRKRIAASAAMDGPGVIREGEPGRAPASPRLGSGYGVRGSSSRQESWSRDAPPAEVPRPPLPAAYEEAFAMDPLFAGHFDPTAADETAWDAKDIESAEEEDELVRATVTREGAGGLATGAPGDPSVPARGPRVGLGGYPVVETQQRLDSCGFCQLPYLGTELPFTMTLRMMAETASRLRRRLSPKQLLLLPFLTRAELQAIVPSFGGEVGLDSRASQPRKAGRATPSDTPSAGTTDVLSGFVASSQTRVCALCYETYQREQALRVVESELAAVLGLSDAIVAAGDLPHSRTRPDLNPASPSSGASELVVAGQRSPSTKHPPAADHRALSLPRPRSRISLSFHASALSILQPVVFSTGVNLTREASASPLTAQLVRSGAATEDSGGVPGRGRARIQIAGTSLSAMLFVDGFQAGEDDELWSALADDSPVDESRAEGGGRGVPRTASSRSLPRSNSRAQIARQAPLADEKESLPPGTLIDVPSQSDFPLQLFHSGGEPIWEPHSAASSPASNSAAIVDTVLARRQEAEARERREARRRSIVQQRKLALPIVTLNTAMDAVDDLRPPSRAAVRAPPILPPTPPPIARLAPMPPIPPPAPVSSIRGRRSGAAGAGDGLRGTKAPWLANSSVPASERQTRFALQDQGASPGEPIFGTSAPRLDTSQPPPTRGDDDSLRIIGSKLALSVLNQAPLQVPARMTLCRVLVALHDLVDFPIGRLVREAQRVGRPSPNARSASPSALFFGLANPQRGLERARERLSAEFRLSMLRGEVSLVRERLREARLSAVHPRPGDGALLASSSAGAPRPDHRSPPPSSAPSPTTSRDEVTLERALRRAEDELATAEREEALKEHRRVLSEENLRECRLFIALELFHGIGWIRVPQGAVSAAVALFCSDPLRFRRVRLPVREIAVVPFLAARTPLQGPLPHGSGLARFLQRRPRVRMTVWQEVWQESAPRSTLNLAEDDRDDPGGQWIRRVVGTAAVNLQQFRSHFVLRCDHHAPIRTTGPLDDAEEDDEEVGEWVGEDDAGEDTRRHRAPEQPRSKTRTPPPPPPRKRRPPPPPPRRPRPTSPRSAQEGPDADDTPRGPTVGPTPPAPPGASGRRHIRFFEDDCDGDISDGYSSVESEAEAERPRVNRTQVLEFQRAKPASTQYSHLTSTSARAVTAPSRRGVSLPHLSFSSADLSGMSSAAVTNTIDTWMRNTEAVDPSRKWDSDGETGAKDLVDAVGFLAEGHVHQGLVDRHTRDDHPCLSFSVGLHRTCETVPVAVYLSTLRFYDGLWVPTLNETATSLACGWPFPGEWLDAIPAGFAFATSEGLSPSRWDPVTFIAGHQSERVRTGTPNRRLSFVMPRETVHRVVGAHTTAASILARIRPPKLLESETDGMDQDVFATARHRYAAQGDEPHEPAHRMPGSPSRLNSGPATPLLASTTATSLRDGTAAATGAKRASGTDTILNRRGSAALRLGSGAPAILHQPLLPRHLFRLDEGDTARGPAPSPLGPQLRRGSMEGSAPEAFLAPGAEDSAAYRRRRRFSVELLPDVTRTALAATSTLAEDRDRTRSIRAITLGAPAAAAVSNAAKVRARRRSAVERELLDAFKRYGVNRQGEAPGDGAPSMVERD